MPVRLLAVVLATLLAGPARAGDFSLVELIALSEALESQGHPQRAIAVMDRFRFNFGQREEYWARLGRLYQNNYDFERALQCQEHLSELTGLTVADALRQARLLCQLLRPEGALERLLAVQKQASDTDLEYWNLVGDLARRVEKDELAAAALRRVWQRHPSPEAAERLVQALEPLARPEEAIAVAEQGYLRYGLGSLLESAIDVALEAGLIERAKALFARSEGHEDQLAFRSHVWLQRALFAIAEEKPAAAERDLVRALAADPGAHEAHREWLKLALGAQDGKMATRALAAVITAEQDPDSLPLLAEAHAMLGHRAEARRLRRLDRLQRARLREGPAETPAQQLELALERRDRPAIRAALARGGTSLSLPQRVTALRELGQDHAAWRLISEARLTGSERNSPDALALDADIRSLRESYLDGAWGELRLDSLGQLSERALGAHAELRLGGDLFVGAAASLITLGLPADRRKAGTGEQRLALTGRKVHGFGETSLRLGAAFLPEGTTPQLEAGQRLHLPPMTVTLTGVYGELPSHSVLLRLGGLRDGIDANFEARLANVFQLGAALGWSRFTTRQREPLTNERSARLELAAELPLQDVSLRPRIDGFSNRAPALIDEIPEGLAPLLSPKDSTDDLLALHYSSAGLGLTVASTVGDVGQALGPHGLQSLRYRLDGWGGYVWPQPHPSYAFDGALGVVLARRQEIFAHGFYYADFRRARGQSYWGASLNYAVRWFR